MFAATCEGIRLKLVSAGSCATFFRQFCWPAVQVVEWYSSADKKVILTCLGVDDKYLQILLLLTGLKDDFESLCSLTPPVPTWKLCVQCSVDAVSSWWSGEVALTVTSRDRWLVCEVWLWNVLVKAVIAWTIREWWTNKLFESSGLTYPTFWRYL